MKLNNKGWGTLQMLLLCLGLLVALLVAIYFIGKLYGSFDNAVKNKQYNDLENRIEAAAREYVISNDISVYDNQTIHKSALIASGSLTDLKDNEGNDCNGYVTVRIIDHITYYYGYINCPYYQTKNY